MPPAEQASLAPTEISDSLPRSIYTINTERLIALVSQFALNIGNEIT